MAARCPHVYTARMTHTVRTSLAAWACVCALAAACSDPEQPPVDVDAANASTDAPTDPPIDTSRPVKFIDSSDTAPATGNWRVALPPSAVEGLPILANPGAAHSAYLFDMAEADIQIAGFLATGPALGTDAPGESVRALAALSATAELIQVAPRLSGARTTTADGVDAVLLTTVEVQTADASDVLSVRDAILPGLLGMDPADVQLPDMGWTGPTDTAFVITYQTLHRAADGQTVYVGAVARSAAFDDGGRSTGRYAEDLANGTALAISGAEQVVTTQQLDDRDDAVADIIWIVDESGSMADERSRLATAADQFFQAAVTAGIDFRMGVTDMNELGPGGQPGIFATRQAGGTGDRWLSPSEAAAFATAINDPSGPDAAAAGLEHGLVQGHSAVARHLPRDDGDPQKIREDAQLVLIYASDEMPQSVQDGTSMTGVNAQPTAMQQTEIDTHLMPYISQLSAENATAHLIGEALPFEDPATCNGIHAYGYYELVSGTGGQVGSICQANLIATIHMIINAIAGAGSPLTLPDVPISASIAVTIDGEPLARSLEQGWDYSPAGNSIVFYNLPFDPANPGQIAVSYRTYAQ